MSNKPRGIHPRNYYHIYNRAVEKRAIFYMEKDYEYFIEKIIFYKEKTGVKILAYCILPNHFHLLLKEPESTFEVTPTSKVDFSAISKFISCLTNSYTKYFNCNKDHSGRIFQGPFKSKLVGDDNYLRVLLHYINLNHLKHKVTKKPNEWLYTSHHNYLGELKYNFIDKDYLIDFVEYKQGVDFYKKTLSEIDLEG